MASFLFVHGAFQGGWVWRKVIDLLRTKGHDPHAPTLSGCGYLAKKGQRDKNKLYRLSNDGKPVYPGNGRKSKGTSLATACNQYRTLSHGDRSC